MGPFTYVVEQIDGDYAQLAGQMLRRKSESWWPGLFFRRRLLRERSCGMRCLNIA